MPLSNPFPSFSLFFVRGYESSTAAFGSALLSEILRTPSGKILLRKVHFSPLPR